MNAPQPEPRLFHLVRPSSAPPRAVPRALIGAVGRGRLVTVAEGVEWSDGTVTLRWRGQWPATSAWEGGIDAVLAVHGHNGTTEIRWLPTSTPPISTAQALTDPPTGTAEASAPPATSTEAASQAAGGRWSTREWTDWAAASALRLAAPGVDGRCVNCGLVWPCLSCGP